MKMIASGHKIDQVPEIPLVVEDKVQEYKKTKDAIQLLRRVKVYDEILKVIGFEFDFNRAVFVYFIPTHHGHGLSDK